MIRDLSLAIAPSTHEDQVRELLLKGFAKKGLNVKQDSHGNVLAYKSIGENPVILSAHMDEIGIMVKYIDKDGYIRFVRLGGYDPRYLLGRSVVIFGKEEVGGIVQVEGDIEEKEKIKTKDLFIDTGLTKKELQELVLPGDAGGVVGTFNETNLYIQGKSLDDRLGCYVLLEIAEDVPDNVVLMGSVQEEVSHEGKGAMLASWELDPSMFIAVEVAGADDAPGGRESIALGKGPAITVSEISAIGNVARREFVQGFLYLANKEGIDVQLEVTEHSATEASNLFNMKAGIPSIAISTPIRYIHTFNEMAHKKDIEDTIRLLRAFLRTLQ
ncbi:MAG: hypothetical protein GXN92_00255 [Candidatus Micrarchaeota archaeon]|nr:hypothetical protein [Candidatus Micrarchaeota archaeon]